MVLSNSSTRKKKTPPINLNELINLINRRIDALTMDVKEAIIKEITARQYDRVDADKFYNKLLNTSMPVSDIKSFSEYIQNGGGYDLTEEIDKDKTIILKASNFEMSEDMFREIISYKIVGETGKGELSAILFKTGRKQTIAGDININDKKIEVKAYDGKLQNTSVGNNYADGREVMRVKLEELLKELKNPIKKAADPVIDATAGLDELTAQVDEKKEKKEINLSSITSKDLNIGTTNLRESWLTLKNLASESGLSDINFAEWFAGIFYGGIWKTETYYSPDLVTQLKKETEDYFGKNTRTKEEAQSFLNKLGWHSLLYYQKCDKFEKLLYAKINSSNIVDNSIIIYDPLNATESEFSERFRITNGPSWTDARSNSSFRLRAKSEPDSI